MLTITLICNLGMSTSLLIKKMVEYAKTKGIDADVDACPFDRIDDRIGRTDILLIGPQVRHLFKKLTAAYSETVPVIEIMNMSDYALVRVDKIFDESYALYLEKKGT